MESICILYLENPSLCNAVILFLFIYLLPLTSFASLMDMYRFCLPVLILPFGPTSQFFLGEPTTTYPHEW